MGKVESHGRYSVKQPEVKGTILAVRQLQDRGRLQVPKEVRKPLDLEDGDDVYWIKGLDGRFYIAKAVEII